jgi:hypothetical protein
MEVLDFYDTTTILIDTLLITHLLITLINSILQIYFLFTVTSKVIYKYKSIMSPILSVLNIVIVSKAHRHLSNIDCLMPALFTSVVL